MLSKNDASLFRIGQLIQQQYLQSVADAVAESRPNGRAFQRLGRDRLLQRIHTIRDVRKPKLFLILAN